MFERPSSGLLSVAVRCGTIGGQNVRSLYQRGADVAVQVETDRDEGIRANQLLHSRYQVAFPIADVLNLHRTVQLQISTVDRQRGLQLADELPFQPLVGRPSHQTTG